MRIPILNLDHRPWEMQAAELHEMGIVPEPMSSMLWRESTWMEDYLEFLEEARKIILT